MNNGPSTGRCVNCGFDYGAHEIGLAYDRTTERFCAGFINQKMYEANRDAYYKPVKGEGNELHATCS